LVKNGAEQQKHRKSLSPEDKGQMLCNNADACRKQRKSLSPEKKVKILETNADAHKKKQESLSPEDETYLKRIILLHNTNIASYSLLIRKLKYIQKMPLNTKNTKSLSLLNRKVKL
jgi:hypothetical protein